MNFSIAEFNNVVDAFSKFIDSIEANPAIAKASEAREWMRSKSAEVRGLKLLEKRVAAEKTAEAFWKGMGVTPPTEAEMVAPAYDSTGLESGSLGGTPIRSDPGFASRYWDGLKKAAEHNPLNKHTVVDPGTVDDLGI